MSTVKQRDSNIELFRIVTMLLIIAHHYVVNSGLSALASQDLLSQTAVFCRVFGAWGKMGINCFVLITGYYMCKASISAKKFAKLFLEIEFYNIIFYFVFVLSGYELFSKRGLLAAVCPITLVSNNFLSCYLLFYLCIPFLNVLIEHINERMHIRLILLGVLIYTILGSAAWLSVRFPPLQFGTTMNYVSWFIVLYFIAAYIRCYPKKLFESSRIWGVATLLSVCLSKVSVLFCMRKTQMPPDYFVADSNKILALTTAVCGFLFFKNLHMKPNRLINAMGASTFGILLIHTNNASLRQWLWCDLLKNVEMYGTPLFVCHAFGSVLGIFVICFLLDQLRIRFVERPFFKWWDKHFARWADCFCALENRVCEKLRIEVK